MKTKQMEREIEELIHTTHVASVNYEIWWVYNEDRPKYVNVMNRYSEFFSASIHAHFVAMLLALAKLYENRNDTINIRKLINLIRNNRFIEETILTKIEQSLKDSEALISKICILRSNYFTHINNQLNYDAVLAKADIKHKNFKELIDLSYNLLKEISYTYNKSDVRPRLLSKGDTIRLLNDLLRLDTNYVQNHRRS